MAETANVDAGGLRMKYFAYGSNMLTARLRSRAPSCSVLTVACLPGHSLRWHKKSSTDGSGKCDAYATDEPGHVVWGIVFEIDPKDKSCLDRAEGCGHGYREKDVEVLDTCAHGLKAFTYVAEGDALERTLCPYSWYRDIVLAGAREHRLPPDYVEAIACVPVAEDPDRMRDVWERRVLSNAEAVRTKEQIVQTIRGAQSQIRALGVQRLGLFGSFVRGEQRADSDVDLLVEFEQGQTTFDHFIQLSFLLEDLLGRKVELVTPDALSPHIGPSILKEVEYVSLAA
jgi:predicted nucleotidyltransferase